MAFFAATAAAIALVATPALAKNPVKPTAGAHAKSHSTKHHGSRNARSNTEPAYGQRNGFQPEAAAPSSADGPYSTYGAGNRRGYMNVPYNSSGR